MGEAAAEVRSWRDVNWTAILIRVAEALAAGLTAGVAAHAAGGDLAASGSAGAVAALAKLAPAQMVRITSGT